MQSRLFSRPIKVFCVLLGLTGTHITSASTITYFDGPKQYDAAVMPSDVTEGLYLRYDHPYFGGDLYIAALNNGSQAIRNPVDGEAWVVWIYDTTASRSVGSVSFIYEEASDCVLYQNAPFSCGIRVAEDEFVIRQLRIRIPFGTQCLLTRDYELRVDHILPESGGGPLPVSDSPYAFQPSRFRPAEPVLATPDSLRPYLPGDNFSPQNPLAAIPAEVGVIAAVVPDDLGCRTPIENASFEVEATIVPQSGGHTHFTGEEEQADGILWDFNDPAPPTSSAPSPTYTTTTDQFGSVLLKYRPGEIASVERFTATVSLPATDYEPAVTREKSEDLFIKVNGLLHPPPGYGGQNFVYADGGGCPHLIDDRSGTSFGHYFNSSMIQRVATLNALYNLHTNNNLSLNDGSLPYGGRFDNEFGNGRGINCHESHRRGIDLDINGVDTGDGNLRDINDTVTFNGDDLPLGVFLTDVARMIGLEKIPEGWSIHYRQVPNN